MGFKKLETELKKVKGEIILLEVSSENFNEASFSALRGLLSGGKLGIVVSANRPYTSLLSLYKKHNINPKNLLIIDTVTHNKGIKTKEVNNIFFVENIRSLTTISIMVRESIKKITKPKFVFIDSVTSMLIYNNPEVYVRFLHSLINEMRNNNVGGVFVFVDEGSNAKVGSQLRTICDKVIKLDKSKSMGG